MWPQRKGKRSEIGRNSQRVERRRALLSAALSPGRCASSLPFCPSLELTYTGRSPTRLEFTKVPSVQLLAALSNS